VKKEREGEKGKAKKKKLKKPHDVLQFREFDFCACPRKNVIKRDDRGKKGLLLQMSY